MGIHWFSKKQTQEQKSLGLILPGGGARNAYQVGVLKAVEELIAAKNPSPFPAGTLPGLEIFLALKVGQ